MKTSSNAAKAPQLHRPQVDPHRPSAYRVNHPDGPQDGEGQVSRHGERVGAEGGHPLSVYEGVGAAQTAAAGAVHARSGAGAGRRGSGRVHWGRPSRRRRRPRRRPRAARRERPAAPPTAPRPAPVRVSLVDVHPTHSAPLGRAHTGRGAAPAVCRGRPAVRNRHVGSGSAPAGRSRRGPAAGAASAWPRPMLRMTMPTTPPRTTTTMPAQKPSGRP